MKHLLVPMALVAGIIGFQTKSRAQTPAPPPAPPVASTRSEMPPAPPPPDPAGRPGPGRERRGPAPEEATLVPVTEFQGTVRRLTSNDDGIYDGFTLTQGTDSLIVKFDPSLASQMLKIVKPGSNLSVKGAIRTSPDGLKDLRLVSVEGSGQTLLNQPAGNPTTPPEPVPTSGKGKITGMQTGPDARVTGILLDDHRMLKLPLRAIGGLGQQLQTGITVSYTGQRRPRRTGEVSVSGTEIIDANTVTINGQQYLVR